MQTFTSVRGKAAPMLAANIDTDVIMPKQFLKGIDRNGLDRGVFFDQRFLSSGDPNPDFILNKSDWQPARFLVVGPNFGCGSSREHAVWGLKQLGIRALIGTSFAGIFFDNCRRNGILTIKLNDAEFQQLAQTISAPDSNELGIDLGAQQIQLQDGHSISFEIDALSRNALLSGLDAIGSTLQRADQIRQFEQQHLGENPWLA
ncbi:3-isopropylmalate dehydratase small subunit [Marinobacterium aestuarii]|uniref:3-isopropylmalate dehydratase small subunit n=1 Tax=Marinobacterium aestuarii TaxID=1821621 RepID=A0A1A9F413_9GAMM|nr:3-isopropylmalate dehydratase small subunit [Marinobacterium aestuarii]ANG64463.1 3-isopropylmalate dehydratase small subunit [Marinobacterium aestuarii]